MPSLVVGSNVAHFEQMPCVVYLEVCTSEGERQRRRLQNNRVLRANQIMPTECRPNPKRSGILNNKSKPFKPKWRCQIRLKLRIVDLNNSNNNLQGQSIISNGGLLVCRFIGYSYSSRLIATLSSYDGDYNYGSIGDEK